jgi:hypothetical protein
MGLRLVTVIGVPGEWKTFCPGRPKRPLQTWRRHPVAVQDIPCARSATRSGDFFHHGRNSAGGLARRRCRLSQPDRCEFAAEPRPAKCIGPPSQVVDTR